MTTSADERAADPQAAEIIYEGPALTFGGYDAAVFSIKRRHQHGLECELDLALDVRQRLETHAGPLSDGQMQAALRALGLRYYRALLATDTHALIPPIHTLRALDLSAEDVDAALHAARAEAR